MASLRTPKSAEVQKLGFNWSAWGGGRGFACSATTWSFYTRRQGSASRPMIFPAILEWSNLSKIFQRDPKGLYRLPWFKKVPQCLHFFSQDRKLATVTAGAGGILLALEEVPFWVGRKTERVCFAGKNGKLSRQWFLKGVINNVI